MNSLLKIIGYGFLLGSLIKDNKTHNTILKLIIKDDQSTRKNTARGIYQNVHITYKNTSYYKNWDYLY